MSLLVPLSAVIFVFCYTRIAHCCSTTCDAEKNAVEQIPTAVARCTQIVKYRLCVVNDTASCTSTEYSAKVEYARTLETAYCSPDVVCIEKLSQCYENYTVAAVIQAISGVSSANAELCWSLVRPVLECLQLVRQECQGQEGVQAAVTNRTEDLMSICNDTSGCVGKSMQCQAGIEDPAASVDTSQHQNDSCFYSNFNDPCSAYQKALDCIRTNLTSCTDTQNFDFNGTAAALEDSVANVCDPGRMCSQELTACLCHINGVNTSLDTTSVFRSICEVYPPFQQCLTSMRPVCLQQPDTVNQTTSLLNKHKVYYDLLCTPQKGLCPAAVQCLRNLPLPNPTSSTQQSVAPVSVDGDLDIVSLCQVADPILNCMENASIQCGVQPSNVSFSDLKDVFKATCVALGPQADKLSACQNFSTCMREYTLGMTSQTPDTTAMTTLYAGLTNTSFWCGYLHEGAACLTQSLTPCGLQPPVGWTDNLANVTRLCQGPVPVTTSRPPAENTTVTMTPATAKPVITEKPAPGKGNGDATSTTRAGVTWTLTLALLLSSMISLS